MGLRNSLPTASSGGVTDHGALTGLGDDDHSQYHNDARGDARYTPVAHVGSGGTAHSNASGASAGFMSSADKTKLDGIASGSSAQWSKTDRYEVADSGATWTKESWTKVVRVFLVAGGGGGASGQVRAAPTACIGGGGGSAGAVVDVIIPASYAGSSQTITVGAGGNGGSVSSGSGFNAGTGGGNSSFGSLVFAIGGGKASNNVGGAAIGISQHYSGTGFYTAPSGGAGGGAAPSVTKFVSSGGGGGGGITAATPGALVLAQAGSSVTGAGSVFLGSSGNYSAGAAGAGAVGTDGPTVLGIGLGGGGGGANISGNGYSGGNGGYGGGGGGGGGCARSGNSGAGGNGGAGYVIVTQYG